MFEKIRFNGTFRTYQQKILDGADKYLADGKINVVAAPGSGKTILGLELIRRLGKPCLILSPTTTIREQWGERFVQGFTGEEDMSSLVSFDLKAPKAITSVTYQALYSAAAKVKCLSDGEEVDNSEVDIFKLVRENGIGTICLDEAHHLQNEWQKTLELFIKKVGSECKVISLTATPPYDAAPAEWQRYIDVCGEIDEEIFVPELVKGGTLCPHQDYVYFNYPSEEEEKLFNDFSARVDGVLEQLRESAEIANACKNLTLRTADINGWIYSELKKLTAALGLFEYFGLQTDKELKEEINFKRANAFDLEQAEIALDFILSEDKLLFENEREELKSLFKKNGLLDRGKVALRGTDKLKRMMFASVGKLKSIAQICKCESENLGKNLRLLVLTDFIKKESLSAVGTDKKFESVSIVSAFEAVRNNCSLPVGAVSGSVVILPVSCGKRLEEMGAKFTVKPLICAGYAEFNIKGGNREKVNYIGKLFSEGEINVLVGTKSLLGEGWDSPCVNTLILASFVGSFMLSNQMRGRAIRVDKNAPDKTANIWHLATVEPPNMARQSAFQRLSAGREKLCSEDFDTLSRRFDCFVAPSYSEEKIKSGIERLTNIKPPYDRAGIERINADMCRRARQRENIKNQWEYCLAASDELRQVSDVPPDRKMPASTLICASIADILVVLLMMGIWLASVSGIIAGGLLQNVWFAIAGLALFVGSTVFIFDKIINKIVRHANPERSVKTVAECLLQTLKELKIISPECSVKASAKGNAQMNVSVELVRASRRDEQLFHTALSELYSPIDYPRYVLIPHTVMGEFNFKAALTCPAILAGKQEYAQTLAKNLKAALGKTEAVYTRGEKGRRILRKCRKHGLVYFNSADMDDYYGDI